jgi:hypothetical protein
MTKDQRCILNVRFALPHPFQPGRQSTMDRRWRVALSLLLVLLCVARPAAAKEGDKNPMVSSGIVRAHLFPVVTCSEAVGKCAVWNIGPAPPNCPDGHNRTHPFTNKRSCLGVGRRCVARLGGGPGAWRTPTVSDPSSCVVSPLHSNPSSAIPPLLQVPSCLELLAAAGHHHPRANFFFPGPSLPQVSAEGARLGGGSGK